MNCPVWILEPYAGGSHADWLRGLERHSCHSVRSLTLSARHWKWRMASSALPLARKWREAIPPGSAPGVLVAGDMLDLGLFLARLDQAGRAPRSEGWRVVTYFHENQFSYPRSPQEPVGRENLPQAMVNYTNALLADEAWFNSDFHREDFLNQLAITLGRMPAPRNRTTIEEIRQKSRVVEPGLELSDQFSGEGGLELLAQKKTASRPMILWNHRREYDKNPEEFFAGMEWLRESGRDFELVVLGQEGRDEPDRWRAWRESLSDRIRWWGYCQNPADYADWLERAHYLPVTSHHDFFGLSVAEAVCYGVRPFLPRRLSYPLIYEPDWPGWFYPTQREKSGEARPVPSEQPVWWELLAADLDQAGWRNREGIINRATWGRKRFAWPSQIRYFDEAVSNLAGQPPRNP